MSDIDHSPLPWKLVPNGDTDIVVDAAGAAIGELLAEDGALILRLLEAYRRELAAEAAAATHKAA